MAEELSVRFTGDTSDLTKATQSGITSVNKFSTAVVNAQGQLKNLPRASDQATNAILNLSRVAQDAPYGIIGIANNLNPLLESFQRTAKEAGSFKNTLQALGGALIGGGGIGLALGVGSSLLVAFGDKLFGTSRAAKDTSKSIKEVSESLESIAAGIAGSSIANIEKFRIALTDVSLSTDQRRKALEEYNKVAATSNQLQESDLSNLSKVNAAIDTQINLLKTRALIEGAQKSLAKAFEPLFAAQFKLFTAQRENAKNLNEFAETFHTVGKEAKDFGTNLTFDQSLSAATKEGFKVERALHGASVQGQQTGGVVKDLLAFMRDLVKQADLFGGAFDGSKEKAKKAATETKIAFRDAFEEFGNTFDDAHPVELAATIKVPAPGQLQKEISASLEESNKIVAQRIQFSGIGERIGDQIGNGFGDVFGTIFLNQLNKALDKGLKGADLEKFLEGVKIAGVLGQQAILGLGDAFGALGSALIEGKSGIQAFGQSLKNTFAQVAAQLLKTIALAAILSAISGPAGGGLSFISAFKGLLGGGKIPGFAQGGIVPNGYPNDSFLARLTSGEMVVPRSLVAQMQGKAFSPGLPSNMAGMVSRPDPSGGVIVGELSGDMLRLWLSRANKKGGRS